MRYNCNRRCIKCNFLGMAYMIVSPKGNKILISSGDKFYLRTEGSWELNMAGNGLFRRCKNRFGI
jgi:hypothetical protein